MPPVLHLFRLRAQRVKRAVLYEIARENGVGRPAYVEQNARVLQGGFSGIFHPIRSGLCVLSRQTLGILPRGYPPIAG
jgi:hypothetical protein